MDALIGPLRWIHVLAGTLALVVAPGAMLTVKGGDDGTPGDVGEPRTPTERGLVGGAARSRIPVRRGSGRCETEPRDRREAPRENTMLRTRVLRPRWLTVALVLWAAAWLSLPAPADGAPLPPAKASTADGAAGGVELAALRQALVAQGLTPADAELVLARLTPAERAELAQRVGELAVGGDGTLLIIGLILLVAILLYLPLAGRMQGWWR
jgi:hypothetical protein